ncbi:MAG: amino-acid N-acetyltransferase [Pantoea sp. Brub]|nr:amino-acid N-acetyltransferase [Pantoea sp. Brub]
MKKRNTELVQSFRHIVPYINSHRGKIFVIMLAGEAIAHNNFYNIINDIGLLHSLGIRLVLVYGIRPQVESIILQNQLQSVYHKSIRITDSKSFELIKQIAGCLQFNITALLSMSLNNTPLQGAHINVVSGNFIIAQPLGIDEGVDYYHSGKIRRIDDKSIHHQLNNNTIVLLGPIAVSVTGESFNLISEEIATQLTIKLKADKMIGFSSSQGIIDNDGVIISELLPKNAEQYIHLTDQNHFLLETRRFIQGAIKVCRRGVSRCHLISYQENGAILQELFSRDGIGTQIVKEPAEQIRYATINDIGGILKLIRPLEEEGILVRRSREQLEIEINNFIIIHKDNITIACAALYPFIDEKIGEMACLAVHPDYRNSSRGEILLQQIFLQARKIGLEKIFVLTTRSIHWFQERGFKLVTIEFLPKSKKQIYNYQRRSKILVIDIIN